MSRSTVTVLLTIAGLSLAGLVGIVAVSLAVEPDKAGIIIPAILGFLTPTIATLLLLLKVDRVDTNVKAVASSINGRLEEHAKAATTAAVVAGTTAAVEAVKTITEQNAAAADAASSDPSTFGRRADDRS